MSTDSLPEQQNALLITATGGVRMTLGKRPVPKPGADQVLVHNVAVALNPVDMYVQKMGMFVKAENLPTLCGNDAAGEVCALGSDVQGWNIGDKVFYQAHNSSNDRRAFQEYTLADAERMARIPTNITFEQAATIPLCLAVAAVGIYANKSSEIRPEGFDRGGCGLTPPWAEGGKGKYAGQAALVISGASSVGQFALQLLKLSGFNPIVATASSHNEAYCKAAGATHVVDYKTTPYDELPAIVKSIVGSTPVGFVYDAAAKKTNEIAFSVLSPGGGMATVFIPQAGVGKRGEDDEQGRRIVGVYGSVHEEEHKAFGKEMYANLTGMLERGELKPNNVRVIEGGLGGIPAGCDELEKGVSGVKLVARIRD
ncbi:GroES-like protein [Peniophora sp. CONT]|nr:GroES-like protein [Peniophora sp. CONT]